MNQELMPGVIYLIFAIMLVLSGLINRRARWAQMGLFALGWVTIFAAGLVLLTYRDQLAKVGRTVWAEVSGDPVVDEAARAIRIPQAADGHFWIDASVDGTPVRFLVDSGATVTTLSRGIAAQAGLAVGPSNTVVRTANGTVMVGRAQVRRLQVAAIEQRDVRVLVGGDDVNVLGMNFLSSLKGWGVEGHWLVLRA